ncbi:hypothetical protein PQX77_001536, partial [Marasmius sp. AFHP31]
RTISSLFGRPKYPLSTSERDRALLTADTIFDDADTWPLRRMRFYLWGLSLLLISSTLDPVSLSLKFYILGVSDWLEGSGENADGRCANHLPPEGLRITNYITTPFLSHIVD